MTSRCTQRNARDFRKRTNGVDILNNQHGLLTCPHVRHLSHLVGDGSHPLLLKFRLRLRECEVFDYSVVFYRSVLSGSPTESLLTHHFHELDERCTVGLDLFALVGHTRRPFYEKVIFTTIINV
ncbi:MAG: hypothetical protein OXF02_08105 [Simkaniaceae bacterium]|nr:hypothetical protein [Simkaniaceae bacterium]